MDHRVRQVHKVQLVHWVIVEPLDQMVNEDLMVHREQLGQLVQLVLWDREVIMGRLDQMVLLDQLVSQDPQDQLVDRDHQVLQVSKVLLDLQVLLASQERLVCRDLWDNLVHQEPLVQLVQLDP